MSNLVPCETDAAFRQFSNGKDLPDSFA